MPIRPLRSSDAPACDAIIAGLPDFFFDPHGISSCADSVRRDRGFVVEVAGEVVAFMTLQREEDITVQVAFLATRRDWRGRGAGTRLIELAKVVAHDAGANTLTLFTDAVSPVYAATHAFYTARQFDKGVVVTGGGWMTPSQEYRHQLGG